jgi:aldehyde:ferredoxin oxidoreductase
MIIVKVHTILTLKSIMGGGEFAPADKIGVEAQLTRKVGSEHCHGCSVGCSQVKVGKTGTYEEIMADGPEYETFFSFGGKTGVENIDAIIAGDRLADELGLVTISASSS